MRLESEYGNEVVYTDDQKRIETLLALGFTVSEGKKLVKKEEAKAAETIKPEEKPETKAEKPEKKKETKTVSAAKKPAAKKNTAKGKKVTK